MRSLLQPHFSPKRGLGSLFEYGQKLVAHKRAGPGDDVISRLCATEDVSDVEAAGLLLRASGKGGGIPRYARTDLEIDDVRVRAGDLVILDNGAANHDPAVFAEPDQVDIARLAANHLTFGHGARYCIGAPELQVVFTQLTTRFPTLQLAVDVQELAMRRDVLTGGPPELGEVWFGTGRSGLVSALTDYLARRAATGVVRLPGPGPVVARTILETCVLWAVHLHWDPAGDRETPPPDTMAATLAGLLTHGLVSTRGQT